jgi:hypothetical protein
MISAQERTLVEQLTPSYIVQCIKEHLTCATSHNLSEEEYIFLATNVETPSDSQPVHSDEDKKLRKEYIQGLVDDRNARRDEKERTVAFPAAFPL